MLKKLSSRNITERVYSMYIRSVLTILSNVWSFRKSHSTNSELDAYKTITIQHSIKANHLRINRVNQSQGYHVTPCLGVQTRD